MATDQNQASENGAPEKEAPESGSHATLLKRAATWATNSLLTIIVLVLGIGFGRQVLIWWAEDDAPSNAGVGSMVADGLGNPGRLHSLEFGDLAWSVRRQSVECDQARAALALRSACREVVGREVLPTEVIQPSEAEFLTQLARHEPVEEEPGKWRLYELSSGFPLVVGTRTTPPVSSSPPGTNLAYPARRVVVWGLATPMGPRAWTLYTFQSGKALGAGFPKLPEFPVPPECRKTLSLRVAGGGGMIGFEGPEPAESWKRVYDDWFAGRDWKTATGWQRTGSAWCVRYGAPPGGPIGWVDVRLGTDENGQTRGLLILTPRNANPKESKDT